ncbi:MAG: WbqC family protein [Desulfomonilaceae bacterium]|nr:WbqC family protein [Desulfomonilaceae bacterium]
MRRTINGKRIAVTQSNYVPWKGYFDVIGMVDEFVLYEDVQYTRRDWRNRNRVKTPQGTIWLTIPICSAGRRSQRICDARSVDSRWNKRHWDTLQHHYRRARFFTEYKDVFEALYLGCEEVMLSRINYRFLTRICKLMSISTPITFSSDYRTYGNRTERLVSICKQAGATEYVTGPSAKAYLEEDLFEQEGIRVHHMDFSGYPEYEQVHPPFEHAVSIVDLLFNEGPRARRYMKIGHNGRPTSPCFNESMEINGMPEPAADSFLFGKTSHSRPV